MVLLHLDAHLLAMVASISARMSAPLVDRLDREVAALQARPVAQVAASYSVPEL